VGQPTLAPAWGIGEAEIERENLSLLMDARQSGPQRWKLWARKNFYPLCSFWYLLEIWPLPDWEGWAWAPPPSRI